MCKDCLQSATTNNSESERMCNEYLSIVYGDKLMPLSFVISIPKPSRYCCYLNVFIATWVCMQSWVIFKPHAKKTVSKERVGVELEIYCEPNVKCGDKRARRESKIKLINVRLFFFVQRHNVYNECMHWGN